MRAYLQLLRLPTVFTAMADIILGYQLTQRSFAPVDKFLSLLAASCCLYLAGMVFNDVFDVAQDTVERPERPIPSGRISRRSAATLGTILMVLGVAIAWTVAAQSRVVSVLLVVAILAYDAVLKRTPLGPVAMGSSRFLNVMLGASYFGWPDMNLFWAPPQILAAAGLGIYIVGVTLFARHEASVSSWSQLAQALFVMDAGLAVLHALMLTMPGRGQASMTLLLLALIAVPLNLRAISAIRSPEPARIQGLIRLFLLNYVTLCATIVYWHTGNGLLALMTACLVLPAMALSRLIAMT